MPCGRPAASNATTANGRLPLSPAHAARSAAASPGPSGPYHSGQAATNQRASTGSASGAYVEYLPALSNPFGRDDANFSQGWTSFYWAWWISWSPFVGMFIARVSRGRTVREFIFCVLLIPSVVSVLWMTAFGGTAIGFVNEGITAIAEAPLELKLFAMLENMPIAEITSFVAIVLVIVFFVTSSDSGSLVIDTITAGGKVDAPVSQRVFWASFEGLVAIALLLGGGLGALQAASVSTGLPFAAVLLLACYALIKGLMSEPRGQAAKTQTAAGDD